LFSIKLPENGSNFCSPLDLPIQQKKSSHSNFTKKITLLSSLSKLENSWQSLNKISITREIKVFIEEKVMLKRMLRMQLLFGFHLTTPQLWERWFEKFNSKERMFEFN
jgi:hypothetical protein